MKFNKKHIASALTGIIVVIFIGAGLYDQPQVNNDRQTESQSSALLAEEAESTESEESNESESETESENEVNSETEESNAQNTETSEGESSGEENAAEEDTNSSTEVAEAENDSNPAQSESVTTSSAHNTNRNDDQNNNNQTTTSNQQATRNKKQETSRETSAAKQEVVQVVVDLSNINQGILSFSTNYEEGMTAMDATESAFRSSGVAYSVIGSGASAYMEGINNVYEFDHGPMSGWQVEVNDTHISNSAGAEPVYPDSHVYWYYTTDFTK